MADRITDTVTGTLRLGACDCDPLTGWFTQPDPILDPADPVQWNAYAYGANNPIDRPDPSGLFSEPMSGVMHENGGLNEVRTSRPSHRKHPSSKGSHAGGHHRSNRSVRPTATRRATRSP
ncbi:RHS repeat-associated core domain-containing protein [Acidipropionibacterium jensenii]|uniref:RHS repeat-associated core domain-containing protein n=1 Tax=Acidipropionibacterium jensenii TaxID=1749 RepID=UPI0035A37843